MSASICTLIILFGFSAPPTKPPAKPLANFDTKGLADSPPEKSRASPKKAAPKLQKTTAAMLKPEAEINQETIDALTKLIEISEPGPKRTILLLNRAKAHLIRTRKHLATSSHLGLSSSDKNLLRKVIADLQSIRNQKGLDQKSKLRAQYLTGLAHVYLDENSKANTYFVGILASQLPIENTGWVALVVADELFEKGQYQKALYYYRHYYPRMTNEEKTIAQYKMAWTHINLGEMKEAEKLFVSLIRASPNEGFGKDSGRDLAFILANNYRGRDLIKSAKDLYKDPLLQRQFLEHVRALLLVQNTLEQHNEVARYLLKSAETDEKLALLIDIFRASKKEFASRNHHQTFVAVKAFMEEEDIETDGELFKKSSEVLERELRVLMRNYIEAFAGRIKTPETFTNQELGERLIEQFQFFEQTFIKSNASNTILGLHLDVCNKLRRIDCMDEVEKRVDSKKMPELASKLLYDRLVLLDELKDATLLEKMEDFYLHHRNHKQWKTVAGRYVDLLTEKKDFNRAAEVAGELHQTERGEASFYRLQWSRFQLGEYSQLLEDPDMNRFERSSARLKDLRREASLKVAIQAREKGDLEQYRSSVSAFIDLTGSGEKAKIARDDYFQFLLEKGELLDLSKEMLKIPYQERFGNQYSTYSSQCWIWALQNSKWDLAIKLTTPDSKNSGSIKELPKIASRRTLSEMIRGKRPAHIELKQMSSENRLYILSLYALLEPNLAIRYFLEEGARNKDERSVVLQAVRAQSGSVEVDRTTQNERLLGAQFSFRKNPSARSKAFLDKLKQTPFPSPGSPKTAQAAFIQRLVGDVRFLRKQTPKMMQDEPAERQLEILEGVILSEKNMAQTILKSKRPEGLNPDELAQYDKGLEEAASEFEAQEEEFSKIQNRIKEVRDQDLANYQSKLPPDTKGQALSWDQRSPLRELAESGNRVGAMILLDLLKESKQGYTSQTDYFRARVGIASMKSLNEAQRIQLFAELEKAGENQLMTEWKSK